MSHWSKQYSADVEHQRTRPKKPPQPVKDRKERFAELNAWIMSRSGAWLVSIPGDFDVLLDVLPGSAVPDELAAQGYRLKEIGESQRILPHAITEIVITEEDAAPIRMTHFGIVRVLRYSFPLG